MRRKSGRSEKRGARYSADVRTLSGTYDGYRVVRECPISPDDPNEIGVIGTGAACFDGVACDDFNERWKAWQHIRVEMRADVGGAWTGDGFGARCTFGPRTSARVSVNHERAVDEAIRRIGTRLKKEGLGEEVVIRVAGPAEEY